MGKLSKERTANVFLHCFCMWTIYGATRNIAECKWILQQELLKEFYFEFWFLVKWSELCVSKQTFRLWIGSPQVLLLPKAGSPQVLVLPKAPQRLLGPPALHCTAPQGGAVGFHPPSETSQLYDTCSALTARCALTALILKSLEHLQTCKSWCFSAKGV